MASTVDICNKALIKIGEDTIIDLTENSKAARLCNQIYADLRDTMLREHPWNFAIKRAQLARLTTDPIFEFDAQFQLPSDCLKVLRTDDDLSPYRVEGKALLVNSNAVKIEYISRVEDTTMFDSLFVEALSDRIGAHLVYNLADNTQLVQIMEQKALSRIRQARSMDGQEGIPRSVEADQWLNTRL